MCGIAGIFSTRQRLPAAQAMHDALTRLQRRGPDDEDIWCDGPVMLGHRRLAVLDLSPAGRQPMQSADGRYVIVFNGEIYNHLELRDMLDPPHGWRSTSDTETLLEAYRAWGVKCLNRLNGMFAFAIWDREQQTLFAARDRLGVKPLYISCKDGEFAFASRPLALRCLLADDAGADPQAIRTFLELGYLPAPLSYETRIQKLPAAHYVLVSARDTQQQPRIARYWDFRHIAPDASLLRQPERELSDELDELIRRAVRARLLSDVPVGAFLSGGVDSAYIVAAMAASGGIRPRAFTIGFHERTYDETPAATAIARHLGVEHVHERLGVDQLLELLPQFIEEFDEPFADSSAFPTLALARLARRHVTVALSGDAGDELFAGYHYYPLMQRLAPYLDWRGNLKRPLSHILGRLPHHRAKLFAAALPLDGPTALFGYMRGLSKDYPALINGDLSTTTRSSQALFEQAAASFAVDLQPAEIAMRLDASLTLPDMFLNKVDVATMAYSLEARCPFTDYRLVEWAMRLPLAYKLREQRTKHLLKQALRAYLPESLIERPKMGFGVPIEQWLRGPLQSWASDLIYDDRLVDSLPLDKRTLRTLFALHVSGKRSTHPILWSALMLLCFESHHRQRRATPPLRARAA